MKKSIEATGTFLYGALFTGMYAVASLSAAASTLKKLEDINRRPEDKKDKEETNK